jgi:lipopolysaccharide biosynthesis regulator YciM
MELLFLLLPVAAFSGWLLGRRGGQRRGSKSRSGCPPLSSDYFQGLNFLLNEQQDEALEVFIRMSEMDSEAVDIQFALASLFLRRGEVDRAIRIHQNLIARPVLSREQRQQALYELGLDYMRAGLLDRAESLFQELADDGDYAVPSRRQLLDIYQQEKEWSRAVDIARRLNSRQDNAYAPVVAHYYCEMAEQALKGGELSAASKLLKRAFAEDRNCVRASLLEAEIAERQQQLKPAVAAYKRIEQQDSEYLPLIIEPLKQCYQQLGQMDDYLQYLRFLSNKEESITLTLALSQLLCERGEEQQATQLLREYLQRRPSLRAMNYLLQLRCATGLEPQGGEMSMLRDILEQLLAAKPVYRCGNCGFTSKNLHWQCPGCKQWGRVKPIHGIEGE